MTKKKILWYQIRKISVESFFCVVLCALVFFAILVGQFDERYAITNLEAFLTIIMIFPSENMPLKEYFHFGFCRKEYYKMQIALCAIRAGIYAIIRSMIHTLFYSEFVADLIGGTNEMASLYHSVSFVELFLGNFFGFFLMMLFSLATNSFLVSMTPINNEITPQLLYRREEKKKKNTSLFKVMSVVKNCVWFLVVVAAGLGMEVYYEFQISSAFEMRILVMGMLAVCCVLIYFYGKRRYQPKYV